MTLVDTPEETTKFAFLQAMNEQELHTVLLSLTPVLLIEAMENVDRVGATRRWLIGNKDNTMISKNDKCFFNRGGGSSATLETLTKNAPDACNSIYYEYMVKNKLTFK